MGIEADRMRLLIDWETSDGRDYVVQAGGILVQDAVTPAECRQFAADWYEPRCQQLEAEGLTRSDAQGVVDFEERRILAEAGQR